MPSVELQAIVPKGAFKSAAFLTEITKVLNEEKRELSRLYSLTYATWDNKPIMHEEVKIGSVEGYAEVSTADKKMLWLDDGTRIRHALMSRNWVSKTKPNRLKSGHGRGKKIFVSRQIKKPGIKPRNWTKIIVKLREKVFQHNVESAVKKI